MFYIVYMEYFQFDGVFECVACVYELNSCARSSCLETPTMVNPKQIRPLKMCKENRNGK